MTATFLKENTKSYHDRLEQLMLTEKIFNKSLSRPEYERIINVNYRVHRVVEPAIEAALQADVKKKLDFNARRKIPQLEKDCTEHIDGSPDVVFKNEAEALGALYVLEGASLGGHVIKKQLSRNPGFEGVQFNYYGMYGDELGEKWRSFLAILEENVPTKLHEDALTGTLKTYQLFIKAAEENI